MHFDISTGSAKVTARNGAACNTVANVPFKAASPAVFDAVARGEVVRLLVTGLGAVNRLLGTPLRGKPDRRRSPV